MLMFSRSRLKLFVLLALALLSVLVVVVLIARGLHPSTIGVINICGSCKRF